jgi:signal transduction histidine kinase
VSADLDPAPATGLDAPIELRRLVPPDELAELVAAVGAAHGAKLAIFDRAGARLAGDDAAGAALRPLFHDGERIGALGGQGADDQVEAGLALLAKLLGLLVHHAYARELAAATHEAAMRLAFTELTEHNQRLSRAVARLEELDRLKSNFLATMSHELRTPLTSVIGYAEMLAEGLAGPVTSDQKDYLTTILGKADQLLGLITAVLEVSSLESGALAIERAAIALPELVLSEVASFAPQAGKRGIVIEVDPGDVGRVVVGDRRKIRQVVANLLSNAVKFTPERGRIAVAVASGPAIPGDPASPPALQVVVRDTGIGIAREHLAKIFEPFYQVDSSSTRAFGGTGLGLTLAKAYVEAHGGRIWVDTATGKGSTFTATFPLEARPAAASPDERP